MSAASLAAPEHGRSGAPNPGLVHQANEFFRLIWDNAEELARLARLSRARVVVDTAGLTPELTALAKRPERSMRRLWPETMASPHTILDTTAP
jgi:hypothetical protein